jgi:VanZ family protein
MKAFAYLFILAVIIIILSATFQWNNPITRLLSSIKYSDKMAHLILIGTLAYCINYLMNFRVIKRFNQNILLGTLLVTFIITLEEFSQNWISTRNFDLVDLLANYIGIAIASLVIIKTKPNIIKGYRTK